jgi:hypothetical protein
LNLGKLAFYVAFYSPFGRDPDSTRFIAVRKSRQCRLERWQPEGISSVLDPEYTHQKAVHAEENCRPDDHCCLLGLGVLNPWDTKSEVDRREGQ